MALTETSPPTRSLLSMLRGKSWKTVSKSHSKQAITGAEEEKRPIRGREKNNSQNTAASSKTTGCHGMQVDQAGSGNSPISNCATHTATSVETSADRFLTKTSPCRPIVMLDRREIQVGQLLGEGAFCEVFEVQSISLLKSFEPSMESSSIQEQSRQQCRQVFADAPVKDDNGTPKYALKQVSSKILAASVGFQKQHAALDLLSETNYLCRLDHPNILKVHVTAMDSGAAFEQELYQNLFLISDRMAGTLYQLVKVWKQELELNRKTETRTDVQVLARKTRYALQIVNALEYLHERRIIYRDLKPANVGYLPASSEDCSSSTNAVESHVGTIQLFDFGFCRELPDNGGSTQDRDKELFKMSRVGSPAYMAPEIKCDNTNGMALYNEKADMFSFALVFYEILMLQHPFLKTRRRKANATPKKLKLLPESLQELFLGTWHSSVEERWTSRQTRARLEVILQELEGVAVETTDYDTK